VHGAIKGAIHARRQVGRKDQWCILRESVQEYGSRLYAQFSDDGGPSQGTLISFRRVLSCAQSGPARRDKSNPERAMSRKRKSKQKIGVPVLSCLNRNAAGLDIGATEIYIAVLGDRDPQPVRRSTTFTEDLHAARSWLKRATSWGSDTRL
jgi:hypothetical protein